MEQKSKRHVDGNGNVAWRLPDGRLHRLDGPAVEWADGDKWWFMNNKLHRLDGPAIEFDNDYKAWYVDGECHRLDGPAREWASGDKEWWIDGVKYTEAEWKKKVKRLTESNPSKVKATCENKIIIIDGVRYKLILAD